MNKIFILLTLQIITYFLSSFFPLFFSKFLGKYLLWLLQFLLTPLHSDLGLHYCKEPAHVKSALNSIRLNPMVTAESGDLCLLTHFLYLASRATWSPCSSELTGWFCSISVAVSSPCPQTLKALSLDNLSFLSAFLSLLNSPSVMGFNITFMPRTLKYLTEALTTSVNSRLMYSLTYLACSHVCLAFHT